MPNIYQTGRLNFKLGTQIEHEDPHQLQAPWPPRSKVARSRNASDRCWPISRERNVLETPKLVGKLFTSRAIMHTSFKDDNGRLTHKVIIRPASSLAQDRESSPAKTSVLPTLLLRQLRNCAISSEWECLRTSNLVHRCSTDARIRNKHCDLQG